MELDNIAKQTIENELAGSGRAAQLTNEAVEQVGLRPWKEQFDVLHDMTDQHLSLSHG